MNFITKKSTCLALVLAASSLFAATLSRGSDRTSDQKKANNNARAIATCVQGNAVGTGKYDGKLADYARDLGGSIPINPCTGTRTGYTIKVTSKTTCTVLAQAGKKCGKWSPQVFNLTL